MSLNIYRAFLDVLPRADLQIATIVSIEGDSATLSLEGGGVLNARGVGQRVVGASVFVRDGVIEADAPSGTPLLLIEI